MHVWSYSHFAKLIIIYNFSLNKLKKAWAFLDKLLATKLPEFFLKRDLSSVIQCIWLPCMHHGGNGKI